MEEPQAKLFVSMQFFNVDTHGRAAKLTLKGVRGFWKTRITLMLLPLWGWGRGCLSGRESYTVYSQKKPGSWLCSAVTILEFVMILSLNLCFVRKSDGMKDRMCEQR